jgi:hypothetical protein
METPMTLNIRIHPLHRCLALVAALSGGACGGGDAAPAYSVTLHSERSTSIDALAAAAARERGAPGEDEVVLYRVRRSDGTPATAEAEQLRALGFRHVATE